MPRLSKAHLGQRYWASAPLPALAPGQTRVRDRLRLEAEPDAWEAPPCLCGGEDGRIVTDIERHGLPYRKVLCDWCGLMRATPRWTPERYKRFYDDDYRDLYSPATHGLLLAEHVRTLASGPGALHVAAFVRHAWRDFGRNDAPVVMEMGAGGGWNLAALPADWTRVGYDTDPRYLVAGREAFGIDMRNGFIDDVLPDLGTADVVLLSHVLEHISDPMGTLQRIAGAARPDALILIEVPGIFRLHKTGMDPMRYWQNAHTYTFCARTLADTCRRAGFEPLRIDEHIQMVFRPDTRAAGAVLEDSRLADEILAYLNVCDRLARMERGMPSGALGSRVRAAWMRLADALVRALIATQLLSGPGRHLVEES